MAYLSLKVGDIDAKSKGVIHDNITNKCSKSLVIPTGKTIDHMAFKIFRHTIALLKVDRFEGISNWIKINGMVNDHSSCYNS